VDMIHHRPAALEDMLEISGVGRAKLEKYGQIFLDALSS
jgi:ATP-dependent DNA helicase RecQ